MSRRETILIVDDDRDLLQLLTIRLQRAGYAVESATNAREALARLAHVQAQAVITDLRMQGMNGIELLTEIEARFPVLPVILLTAHGTIPDAVAATKKGAFAFLTKPLNDDELIATVKKAVGASGRVLGTQASSEPPADWRSGVLTRSPLMEALLQEAKLAAASDASIVIESDSGTGKEVLARAIHAASPRAQAPFVPVNCTAIPESLVESEMFGHVRGAFTGAQRDRIGLYRKADKGTLFLDEIGDMPMAFQAKLLRALQERTIRPVGSEEAVNVDVRIIVATHKDLEKAVSLGEFREDLFYRLSVVTLRLPSLAQRREDIPLLCSHFLRHYKSEGVATGFSTAAMERLVTAPWPGNVRQLMNVVHQCVVLCRSRLIPESLVDRALRSKPKELVPFATARDQFELEYLGNLMHITGGNVSQAARLAERNRSEFYKLLRKHGLDPARFRAADQDEVE